jgi:hypothetical protein
MAYGIMGSTRSSFMLTYQATRPIKCLYFDGESATLMGLGQLDTQMLHLYGNVTGPVLPNGTLGGLQPEYARANGLCEWLEKEGLRGRGWGFEGVVRMNAGFEVVWCDFMSESLRLISRLDVTAPQLPAVQSRKSRGRRGGAGHGVEEYDENGNGLGEDHEGRVDGDVSAENPNETSYFPLPPVPTRTDRSSSPTMAPVPPNWRNYLGPFEREPFLRSQGWGWFLSATYHYGSNRAGPGLGEARAKILGCGLSSYYSPLFANQSLNRAISERKSLNLTDGGYWKGGQNRTVGLMQLARRRRYHHLEGVTPREAGLMKKRSAEALRNVLQGKDCTGANWYLMMNEIVQRTAGHLKGFEQQLESFSESKENSTTLRTWMRTVREKSHGFMVAFLEYPHSVDDSTWAAESKLYSETYSRCRYHYTRLLVDTKLLPPERDLRWAVEETFGNICTVLLTLGFEIEHVFAKVFDHDTSPKKYIVKLEHISRRWGESVAELIAWLGWEGEYLACNEVCGWNQRCFIPMWPLLGGIWGRRPQWNGTFPHRNGSYPHWPYQPSRPGYPYGYGGGPPRWSRPPRGPIWMGDDRELWEPRCVSIEHIMGA